MSDVGGGRRPADPQTDFYGKPQGFSVLTISCLWLFAADPPLKENPYEDIETNSRCLGKKCVLTFPASPTSSVPGTPTKLLSKPMFFRQNSERRSFKLPDIRKLSRDGTGSPSKISPPSTPSSPDDTFFSLGDPQNGKRRRKIPKVNLELFLFCLASSRLKCEYETMFSLVSSVASLQYSCCPGS
uniref:Uncharacterized protein n=1 Tax=Strix occidentalis caurina TaxID=311401 RepID=A0A8D0FR51_STROC